MKVLHLLASGGAGGIETLCKDYATFSKHENVFVFIWNSGCIAEEMRLAGTHIIEINASKKNLFMPMLKILKICKKEKIEAIVVHHAAPVAHIYMMISKIFYPKIKTFAYAHGYAEDMCRIGKKKGSQIRKFIMKCSIKQADCVVAISNAVKNSLVHFFEISENKIVTIYNGVNIQNFKKKKNVGNQKDEEKKLYM